MKKCPKCNTTYNDDINFCTICGTPLQKDDKIVINNINNDDISIIESFKVCFSKWLEFKGNAKFKEYQYFIVYNWIIYIILFVPNLYIWTHGNMYSWETLMLMTYILSLYMLITYFPSLAVTSRRIHSNASKGIILISILHTVALVPLLIFCALDFIYSL